MAVTYPVRNNFNGGELSPKIDWRGDVDKYHSGCITMEGFVPLVEGGAKRMPGTYFAAETKDSTKKSRLVPFRFSTEQAYILEVGNQYIRFYKDQSQITDGGVPVEVVSPYLEADLAAVKYTQSADILYTFHQSYAPRKISRLSHISWTLSSIEFRPPPTRESGHTPAATLTPAAVTGNDIQFTASASVFINGDVGRVIQYGASRASITAFVSGLIVTCDILDDFPDTDPIPSGDWTLLYSTNGAVTPNRKKLGQMATITGDDAAVDLFRSEDKGKYLFINGGFIYIVKINSSISVRGEIMQALSTKDSTEAWTMETASWNATDGYPSCGVFFEQRLGAGGSPSYPQTLNLSVSGDYENFSRDPDSDDAAMEFTLISNQVEGIHWLSGDDFLMIGTFGGVWKFGASTTTDPLAQTNVSAKKQSGIGVKDLAPLPVTDSSVWVSQSGLDISRLDYSFEGDRFLAVNMARVASHITLGATRAESGVVDMAFQKAPIPIVWAVRADGQLLGMTYETQEKIYAWFRVRTEGAFESVAVISNGDEEDEVWVIVRRTINGATVRYVEYFKPHELFGEIKDSFFVHAGVTYDGGDAVEITGITNANPAVVSAVNTYAGGEKIRIKDVEGMTEANLGVTKAWTVANPTGTTFELSGIDSTGWGVYTSGGTAQAVKKDFTTGLDHLKNTVVDTLSDGSPGTGTVSATGTISLGWYGNKVHIGIPVPNVLEPTKPYIEVQGGVTRGKKQRINEVMVSFFESYGCKIGPSLTDLKKFPFGTGDAPEMFTGEKSISFHGSWGDEAPVVITQDLPLPLTIRSLSYKLSVNES